MHFTPHDFRRLLATDLVNNGLPIHIGAALLGHLNIQTTQGYVAIFEEDVIRHVQDFLASRRVMRPQEEYRPATEEEWQEFEEHFDKRKVELGSCGRPYGTSCHHEHVCLRCAQLHVNPKMLPRLDELESDLEERKARAASEAWLGEIEGIARPVTPKPVHPHAQKTPLRHRLPSATRRRRPRPFLHGLTEEGDATPYTTRVGVQH
ncbi:MAG: site-specific integrase [Pseudonocardiaceae bacterium]